MPTTKTISTAGRVLAAVSVLAATLWLGPAATAAVTVTFPDCAGPTPTPSQTEQRVCSGSAIRGDVTPRFDVVADNLDRIREIRLYVLSDDEGITSPGDPQPGDPVAVFSWPERTSAPGQFVHPRDATEPFVWETKKLTPYNGSYTFKVWVQTHGAPSAQTAEAPQEGVLVDNAPATPAAPKVAGIDGRKVTIRWDEAPEPDVEHYYLYPARTQSPDQTPEFDPDDRIKVDGTEYVHEVPQAGAWWYKIRVVRYSPADADGIWSDPSERSAQPGVVAAPTPSPEPTKDPDGGSGNTSRSRPRRASGPLVSPRPIVRANKPPPVRDAPYTAILPYDLPEDGSDSEEGAGPASFGRPEVVADDEGAQTVLPIVAAGLFLVSAALAIGRMPT